MIIKHFHTIGKKATQEDAFYISTDHHLFVVCDGVGGRHHGGLASQSIVNELTRQYESQGSQKRNFEQIKKYLNKSLQKLDTISEGQTELKGISTTLALLYVEDDQYHTAHIGDSRVILLSGVKNQCWSTKDHSVVQELYDAGVLKSELDMKTHPYRNRITKAITASQSSLEDITFQSTPKVNAGDCLVLCTDGLLEHYTNSELQSLFNSEGFESLFDNLKKTCEENSKDNTTVILIQA